MEVNTYRNDMPYIFDGERTGAKYSLDNGKTWKNHGEFLESAVKYHLGLEYLVNPATSYDTGSDIEELNASIKSSKATLASLYGNSYDEIVSRYFETVRSSHWIYVIELDEQIVEYHMNAKEFKEFLDNWARLQRESNCDKLKVRIKTTSSKMIKWFEAHL